MTIAPNLILPTANPLPSARGSCFAPTAWASLRYCRIFQETFCRRACEGVEGRLEALRPLCNAGPHITALHNVRDG